MLLVEDIRDGRKHPVQETEAPTLDRVERAVREMDGRTHTIVSLSRTVTDSFLGVSGGGTPGYYVSLWTEDEHEWAVVGDSNASGTVQLLVGGQEIRCPRTQIVDLDTALVAIRAYFCGTDMDPGLKWEKVS